MYYINKIKNHLSNWLEYGKEHLLRILLILFLLAFFSFLITRMSISNIYEKDSPTDQIITIFGITLENWST